MVSIILPVYNPAAGWSDVVLAETARLQRMVAYMEFEFIIVNDGSANDAYGNEKHKIADSKIKLIEYNTNKGKGYAIRTGAEASSGEIIIYTDIDFPYTVENILQMITMLQFGPEDVVIGIKDSRYYEDVPAFRKFASKLLRLFTRLFFRIPTDDFMCGLKGFNQKGKALFLQTTIDRYLFDLEFMRLLAAHPDVRSSKLEVRLKQNIEFRKMNPTLIVSELKDLFSILFKSYKKK
ncbi:MAG: glycosyl transferase family 2 [Bacteroidetes bacterium]|nr:glycosyl transferase family 2 [Bacteroidota bacterium]